MHHCNHHPLPLDLDKPQDECGVFGIWDKGADLGLITHRALIALQHRGQESAGIVHLNKDNHLEMHRGMGLVTEALDQFLLADWNGTAAIGHVRYSTTGQSAIENAQPILLRSRHGHIALAHNGNLVNAKKLRHQIEAEGSIFYSTVDTEVIAHLMARSENSNIVDVLSDALERVRGSYSMVLLSQNELIAVRDPHGIRPLSLGKTPGGYVVASETCAFDTVGAQFIRDIEPGEIVRIGADGIHSRKPAKKAPEALCSFEYVYISRNDSIIQGWGVHSSRVALGKMLAREAPVDADVVIGVPDSSYSAASGYSEESGLPFKMGLNRNRYIGRTFIQPQQVTRAASVSMKLSAVRSVVDGRRIVLIDDSLVRGTTMSYIVHMLREAGAKEIHVRISSPPFVHPCFYGVDVARSSELLASMHNTDEICKMIGSDSLAYLSLDALNSVMSEHGIGTCTACFDGHYPVDPSGA